LALLLAGGSALAQPAAEPSTVPFELYKGHIFVHAFVNGRGPYLFGFDTGASGMGRADASLTKSLSLPKVEETANSDGIRTVTNDVVAVDSLRLGDIQKHDVRLISRDYNHGRQDHPIMGIIARDFFAGQLVTISYPMRAISFSEGALHAGEPGVVAYSGSFEIPVCFASGCYPGKVDTGSSRGLVIPKALVGKIAATAPVAIGEGRRTNGTASLYELTLKEPVRVGGISSDGEKVLYAEPSDDVINIGSDFLDDYVLTIDQQHHLLRISRPEN
jgi:hypothetical protein